MSEPLKGLFVFIIGFSSGVLGYQFYQLKNPQAATMQTAAAPAVPENEPSQTTVEAKNEDIRLAAPKFGRAGILESNDEGVIFVNWMPIKGAQEYQLTVSTEDDEVLQKMRISRTKTSIKDLTTDPSKPKTFYRLRVQAVDENGVLGHPSEPKKLAMIPTHNLSAPTIKKITTD